MTLWSSAHSPHVDPGDALHKGLPSAASQDVHQVMMQQQGRTPTNAKHNCLVPERTRRGHLQDLRTMMAVPDPQQVVQFLDVPLIFFREGRTRLGTCTTKPVRTIWELSLNHQHLLCAKTMHARRHQHISPGMAPLNQGALEFRRPSRADVRDRCTKARCTIRLKRCLS